MLRDHLGLREQVFLLGRRDDVKVLLRASDVFVFSSYYEGLPGAVIEAMSAGKPVVVDFWAQWCGPCHMMAPIFEGLAEEMPDVAFVKMNVDETRAGNQYGVQAIPTLILFKDGKVASQQVGVLPKPQLKHWIEQNANGHKHVDPAFN